MPQTFWLVTSQMAPYKNEQKHTYTHTQKPNMFLLVSANLDSEKANTGNT